MSEADRVYDDLEEYVRQSEPDAQRRGYLWQTAVGLQAVDGLVPSDYLIQTAKQNIDGDITLRQARDLIHSYYEARRERAETGMDTEEADKVSAHIAEILAEEAFSFMPGQLVSIHKRLFDGVFDFAGTIRTYNITKREWVLRGSTVTYASADLIRESLDYDFSQERSFDYRGVDEEGLVRHLSRFIANLWQVHPFGEGNTRTTAVFAIKYLRSLGFSVENDLFARHSWYFRNALVRASYSDLSRGIFEDAGYLERFFKNLLYDAKLPLKNRELLIKADGEAPNADITDTDIADIADTDVGNHDGSSVDDVTETRRGTATDQTVLELLRADPRITQAEVSRRLGISKRQVERIMAALRDDGVIRRVGSNRSGSWEVL